MSDFLMREFRAQLTTSMDSVLRRAVFEITMIFENSLRGHQMELAQKGEEVAQLKIKLQSVELKLSKIEPGGDRGAETKKGEPEETKKGEPVETKKGEPVDVPNAPVQPSDVPEIDFEVPDDWCAPLGCETMIKKKDVFCSSIKLRPLSIPLWPLPIIKQEVVNCDIDSHQRTKSLRRSKRSSSLSEKHKDKDEGSRRPAMRNDMKKLLQDIKQECTDQTDGTVLRSRGRNLSGKEQENTTLSKREEGKLAAAESREKETETEKNDGQKLYSCKFCKKEFNTVFGRNVHARMHKKCKGCKREFPSPSALRCHKLSCKRLKRLLAKKAQLANPPKPETCDEENPIAPSKTQEVVEEESTPSSTNQGESSIQKAVYTKKHSCADCNKKFHSSFRLKEHVRVHTGEKPFPCRMCPKKFRINQSLKYHVLRMHKDQTNSIETNENLAWTMPLEETEDCGEDLTSPRKTQVEQSFAHNNVQTDGDPDTRPGSKWETMGTRCPDGFICSLCKKLSRNQYLLIEHFRTHTGERPLKCDRCSSGFRSRGQLSMHKKRCNPAVLVAECTKCNKKFDSQARLIKHMPNCHRDRPKPNLCKVCGKGFFTKGRLKNHMEHLHK
ncbi:uncharacterized protein LOC141775455 [Sebastes fasciatus]|uniref:uncharacterized protein LOC141775455 n=1 Tax=Sebastes fasciatus TaxID=394691 RepID=UPI003D9ED416